MWILLVTVLTGAGPVFQVGMTTGQETCVEVMRKMKEDDLSIVRKALKENGTEVEAWDARCIELDFKGKSGNNGKGIAT